MRLKIDNLGKIKNVLHVAQATIILLAIIITIAVFVTAGSTDGRTGWYFGLCWLTIPILIYLTMVPAWSRAKKFANIYALVSLDCFGAVTWLSAWAAVTSYVVDGKGRGEVKDKGGCENFKFGSTMKCRLSEVTIFFGVLLMLLFIATSLISFKAVMEHKRTGGASGELNAGSATLGTVKPAAHNRDEEEAFDSNMNLRHDWEVEEYDHDDYHDRYGHGGESGRQAGAHGYAPAHVDDHGDGYEDAHHDYRTQSGTQDANHAQQYGRPSSHLGPFSDDHELPSTRPTSTGSGSLGADTSYHSPAYGQGNYYPR